MYMQFYSTMGYYNRYSRYVYLFHFQISGLDKIVKREFFLKNLHIFTLPHLANEMRERNLSSDRSDE